MQLKTQSIKLGYELMGDYIFPQLYEAKISPIEIENILPHSAFSNYCDYVQAQDYKSAKGI